jgi:CheY-like chemotaxis protein
MDSTSGERRKSVLIVEDEDAIRETLRQVLEFEGYEVYAAANGREGLEILTSVHPCVIILDLMMPVMNGWEFASTVQSDQANSSIPIVVVSAFAEKAKDLRCQAVLKKPFDIDSLLSVVSRYCS